MIAATETAEARGAVGLPAGLAELLRAVGRRQRLQRLLDGATLAALPASSVVLLGSVGLARGMVPSPWAWAAMALALLAVPIAGLVAARRRIPPTTTALLVDRALGLPDQVRSAVELGRDGGEDRFVRAAIAQAAAATAHGDPRRLAPIRRPRPLAPTVACLLLALLAPRLHRPPVSTVAMPPPTLPPPLVAIDRELLLPDAERAAELVQLAAALGDREAVARATQLQDLVARLGQRQVGQREAIERLGALGEGGGGAGAEAAELKRQLRRAGETLSEGTPTRPLGEALKREQLAEAEQALGELAKGLEEKADERREGELTRALDRAAREPPPSVEERKEQRELQKLEEERRLEREPKEPAAEEPRRLQRREPRLEELRRQEQERQGASRRLERLRRPLREAAGQLERKQRPDAARSLKQARDELRQMEDEIRKLELKQRLAEAGAELTELLRRHGDQQGGQGGDGREGMAAEREGPGGRDADDGAGGGSGQRRGAGGAMVEGEPGQGEGPGQKPSRRLAPLGEGERPLSGAERRLADGKRPQIVRLGQLLKRAGGDDQREGDGPKTAGTKPGSGGEGGGGEQDGRGSGVGDQHDPNLLGAPTRIEGAHQDLRLRGKAGPGPSRAQTILGSAQRGFANAAYRRVYGDYRSVVEEVLEAEQVPPGHRYYVKRYFQLIQPRR